MNTFGINLAGKKGVYKKSQFYRPNATEPTRTFIFEGGPGCIHNGSAGVIGLTFGARTVSGRWEADKDRDSLDVDAFEKVIDDNGKEYFPIVKETKTEVMEAIVPPEPKAAAPVASVKLEKAAAPKPEKKVSPVQAPAAAPVASAGSGTWNPERAVELYKNGMKIVEIAVEMGYARGQGNNRVRGVLKAAGVYKE